MCRGHTQSSAFAPQNPVFVLGSSKVEVEVFVFFVSFASRICSNEFAPRAHAHSYFSSHTVSLYSVAGGEVCPGTSTAAKGPGPRPVSLGVQQLL